MDIINDFLQAVISNTSGSAARLHHLIVFQFWTAVGQKQKSQGVFLVLEGLGLDYKYVSTTRVGFSFTGPWFVWAAVKAVSEA